jgi:hypothetical protein
VAVQAQPTPTALAAPTVSIPQATPEVAPTVTIPRPVPHYVHRRTRRHAQPVHRVQPQVSGVWIWAYLTSYCPGTAGWLSSSGRTVFYGMLANDYYAFGTRVYLPVLGITGVVEDRIGSDGMWNHFDVWSPVCYGTPTGWFRVAVQS